MFALRHFVLTASVLLSFGVTEVAFAGTVNGSGVTAQFADCGYHKDAALLRALVLQMPSDQTLWQDAATRIGKECITTALRGAYGRGISFNIDGEAFAFAEALVRGDYAQTAHFDLATARAPKMIAPPLDPKFASDSSPEAKAAHARHDREETRAFLINFATCVCRQNADAVHKLVLTVPNTPDESSAFGAMSTAFQSCAEQGDFNVGTETLRGALAFTFYRMAGPPAGAQVEPITVHS